MNKQPNHNDDDTVDHSCGDLFADDVCIVIMEFLDARFVLSICSRISHQWQRAVKFVPLSFAYSDNHPLTTTRVLKLSSNRVIVKLDLSHLRLEGEDCKIITSCPSLNQLTELSAMNNRLSVRHFEWFVQSPYLSKLRRLNLHFNEILLRTGTFTLVANNNAYLDCSENQAPLGNMSTNLTNLNVSANTNGYNNGKYCKRGCDLFFERFQFPSLKILNLQKNAINANDCKHIANCSFLCTLTTLLFGYNNIGDEGLKFICESQHLINLRHLHLQRNGIGRNGCTYLSLESCTLRQLQTLNLQWNEGVDGQAVKILFQQPHFQHCHIIYELQQNEWAPLVPPYSELQYH